MKICQQWKVNKDVFSRTLSSKVDSFIWHFDVHRGRKQFQTFSHEDLCSHRLTINPLFLLIHSKSKRKSILFFIKFLHWTSNTSPSSNDPKKSLGKRFVHLQNHLFINQNETSFHLSIIQCYTSSLQTNSINLLEMICRRFQWEHLTLGKCPIIS